MAGIVEAHAGAAVVSGPAIERLRLGAAACRSGSRRARRCPARRRRRAETAMARARRPARRPPSCSNCGSLILLLPALRPIEVREASHAVKPDRAEPCTVLQVVPALETGGAERTTIDIAAALAARGDRALVASQGGRLEAELASAGGELVRLPVGSKNACGDGGERLSGSPASSAREQIDLVHARSRAPAWSALLACGMTGDPRSDDFPRHLWRGERSETALQLRDGAGRLSVIANSALHCAPDHRALRHARGADRRHPPRHRPPTLRPAIGC